MPTKHLSEAETKAVQSATPRELVEAIGLIHESSPSRDERGRFTKSMPFDEALATVRGLSA